MQDDTTQELPQGTVLGDYSIVRTLGQGGFGITYLAVDNTLGSRVVIKENLPSAFAHRDATSLTIHSHHSMGDKGSYEWAVKNFLSEARTLASLDHPNIVKVTRAFSALGTAYFVMPYIEGDSLDKYRKAHGAPTEEWLRSLLSAVLDALTYLHESNLLHRDLKPANILLSEKGKPQLIDFGTARQLLSEKSQTVIESPGYTPLEQMQSHGKVGAWSDIYALGGTLYKLITGDTPPKCTDRIAKQDPHVPLTGRRELRGKYSEALLTSIDKAMNVWPEDRWQTAAEWQQALSASAPAPGVVKAGKKEPSLPPEVKVTKPTPKATPSTKGSPLKKWLLLGGLGTALCVGGLVGYKKYADMRAQAEETARLLREAEEERKRQEAERLAKQQEEERLAREAEAERKRQEEERIAREEEAKRRQEEAEALNESALKHLHGDGVPRDDDKAFTMFKQAAEMGHANAQNNLGFCYEYGRGTAKDETTAVKWYRAAADQGNALAQCNLAICYEYGTGITKNMEEAVSWYHKAAGQGNAGAQNNLAVCYEYGRGVGKNLEEAVRWYRAAAEQGHANGQCNLGLCYEMGTGVDINAEEAVKWYRKAADKGHPRSQDYLGNCYEQGFGVAKNAETAVYWYSKAAEQGRANAQCNLGLCYEFGNGVATNKQEAVRWYRKAAEQGHANAQCNLAFCYANATGVSRDYYEAVRWYRKAADQGLARAQCNLGFCYENGHGVTKNSAEAVRWYRKSAEQGDRTAQYNLGVCYENGTGVKKDKTEAVYWFRKAAEQGHEGAKKALRKYR